MLCCCNERAILSNHTVRATTRNLVRPRAQSPRWHTSRASLAAFRPPAHLPVLLLSPQHSTPPACARFHPLHTMSAPCATVPAAASPLLAARRRSARASAASAPVVRSTGFGRRSAALALAAPRQRDSHNKRTQRTARAALPFSAAASTVRRTPRMPGNAVVLLPAYKAACARHNASEPLTATNSTYLPSQDSFVPVLAVDDLPKGAWLLFSHPAWLDHRVADSPLSLDSIKPSQGPGARCLPPARLRSSSGTGMPCTRWSPGRRRRGPTARGSRRRG